jgi:hypothetical protein
LSSRRKLMPRPTTPLDSDKHGAKPSGGDLFGSHLRNWYRCLRRPTRGDA